MKIFNLFLQLIFSKYKLEISRTLSLYIYHKDGNSK